MRPLLLPASLRAEILAAARAAYPQECCGLIEGCAAETGWRAQKIHPAANLADDPAKGFLIDPKTQFVVLKALRGTDRTVIGCYHSHPNGRPKPSATDLANAIEADFLWLIASGGAEGFALNGFVADPAEGGFQPIALVE